MNVCVCVCVRSQPTHTESLPYSKRCVWCGNEWFFSCSPIFPPRPISSTSPVPDRRRRPGFLPPVHSCTFRMVSIGAALRLFKGSPRSSAGWFSLRWCYASLLSSWVIRRCFWGKAVGLKRRLFLMSFGKKKKSIIAFEDIVFQKVRKKIQLWHLL